MFKHRDEEQFTIHVYLRNPAKMETVERCTYYGNMAAQDIARLKGVISTLEQYQRDIYQQVQRLVTEPYHLELSLKREKRSWGDNKVYYYLTLWKVYDSGFVSPEQLERTTYEGRDRHKALADFAAKQKQYPGIPATKDIAKGRWE